MNNEVKGVYGKVIGFRCQECQEVFESMMGEICNKCRRDNERHDELMNLLKEIVNGQHVWQSS